MDVAHLSRIGVPMEAACATLARTRQCATTPVASSLTGATAPDATAQGGKRDARPAAAPKPATIPRSASEGKAAQAAATEQPQPKASASASELLPLIDVGANLLDSMFQGTYRGKERHPADLDDILLRAAQAGVSRMMVTAGSLDEAREALALCRRYRGREGVPELYCTVGVHPTRCSEFDTAFPEGPEVYMKQLLEVGREGCGDLIVAVGEFGLDYDRLEFCPKEVQLAYFEKQLEGLAATLKLPLFLHCRTSEAAKDLKLILQKHMKDLPSPPGVVHSFDGTLEDAEALMSLGFRIGLNGCSLRGVENLEVVKKLPADMILLETDAPWCSIKATHAGHSFVKSTWPEVKKPEKWEKGSCVKDRCEPCHMKQVLEVVAGCRGADVSAFAHEVHANTLRTFWPTSCGK